MNTREHAVGSHRHGAQAASGAVFAGAGGKQRPVVSTCEAAVRVTHVIRRASAQTTHGEDTAGEHLPTGRDLARNSFDDELAWPVAHASADPTPLVPARQ